MWHWIRHWRDWAMNEIVLPRRLTTTPQALYFRYEKAGLTIDQQAVPWSADAVIVEALLRLPAAARKRNDFQLRLHGQELIPLEAMKSDDASPRHRLFFRFPVPAQNVTAELLWKRHVLGKIDIPIVTAERFQQELQLHLPTTFVALGTQSVAAQTFVSNQQQGLSATVLVRSPTGLMPLYDLGLVAIFRTAKGTKSHEVHVPLTASQLASREALLTALPPKLPRRAGEWSVTWVCAGRELHTTRLKAIAPKDFLASLRVASTRFVAQFPQGIKILRQLPHEGAMRVGPCFVVSSRELGMAGLADFTVTLQRPSADPTPVLECTTLVTDGPTLVAPGLFDVADLKNATLFELRLRGRILGTMPLSPVPMATFNAEGAYKPPPEYTWTNAADDELSERLARLMGLPNADDPTASS